MSKIKNKFITKNGRILDLQKLMFIKAENNKVLFVMDDKSSFYEWARLKLVSGQLFEYPNFVTVHRSYIVNLDFACRIMANKLYLNDGKIIPIGLTQKWKVHELLKV